VDYLSSSSASELESWTSTARSFVENRADAPVRHIIGNHESGYNSSSPPAVYDELGYNSLSETWGVDNYGSFEVIYLNTAYSTTSGVDGHITPQEEVDWLEDHLDQSSKPKVVTMHVPVVPTTGLTYDETENMEQVVSLLQNDPTVQYCVYGHVHHTTDGDSTIGSWDRIREDIQPSNAIGRVRKRGWLHVSTPHVVGADTSKVGGALLELLNSGTGTIGHAKTYYDHNTFPTEWGVESPSVKSGGGTRTLHGDTLILADEDEETFIRKDSSDRLSIQADQSAEGLLLGIANSGKREFRVKSSHAEFGYELRLTDNDLTQLQSGQFTPQSSEPNTYSGSVAVQDGTNWDPAGTGEEEVVAYINGSWTQIS